MSTQVGDNSSLPHRELPASTATRRPDHARPWPPTSPPLIPSVPVSASAYSPAPPVDPGPTARTPWWKRSLAGLPTLAWLGILAFTLVGLGTILAVATSADRYTVPIPPTTGTTPSNPTTTEVGVPTGELGTRDNPIPLGQPAEIGDGWTLTVNSVDLDANDRISEVNRQNAPPPDGMTYIVINATLTYTGEGGPADAFGIEISAVGEGTNVTSNTFTHNGLVIPPDPPLIGYGEVYSGGSITGNEVFPVPDEDLSTLLVLGRSSFVTGEYVHFATS